ncbi:hypothetical protein RchiOBHm_Chr6g0253361 [Rosa chinensis]|uniref:Uncharacterized protein n=1 Tax=Rosa chinensis TaxID=74649 RepID=A0A2P6PLA6_ROSCH|nr:hypothetical protein RchiOBHm_Chr6g0253361 [Rosa chinensis]
MYTFFLKWVLSNVHSRIVQTPEAQASQSNSLLPTLCLHLRQFQIQPQFPEGITHFPIFHSRILPSHNLFRNHSSGAWPFLNFLFNLLIQANSGSCFHSSTDRLWAIELFKVSNWRIVSHSLTLSSSTSAACGSNSSSSLGGVERVGGLALVRSDSCFPTLNS